MVDDPSPEQLFQEGRRLLPSWNDKGPDVEARHERAVATFTRAAEGGHLGAVQMLADGLGGERSIDWAIVLARQGEAGPLVSNLTDGDSPPERCLAVLEAARGGEPWAQHAVGSVYGLGMVDVATGVPTATRDGAYGWLPGVPDPDGEARRWLERAAAAGWAPASLSLAEDDRFEFPERALEHLRVALRGAETLTEQQRARAARHLAKLLDEVEAPLPERIEAWRALVEAGDDDAMAWLGDRYRLGEGVPLDLPRARELYERGAEAGSVDACRELGRMLEEGLGGPADDDRARELYERAAELGADPFSRDRLAEKYGLSWYARKKGAKKAAKKGAKKKA